MSSTPNKRLHEDGGTDSGSGSGNYNHPSTLKYPHVDQGTYSGIGGKVVTSARHDYHASYDMGPDGRMPKIAPRNELRDADRKSPLPRCMLFRVSTSNDALSDHVGSNRRMDFRDSKDSCKEIKVENRDMKSDYKELQQSAKYDKYCSSRGDDAKDVKHERDDYSVHKGDVKVDKDGYSGSNSNSQLNWKDLKEQHRLKQHPDAPGGNAETWHTSRTGLHGSAESGKEGLHIDERGVAEAHEVTGENRVDMKDNKFKEKDRKRKEGKHRDWDKERSDRQNDLQLGNSSAENKELVKEERDSERWGIEKKNPLKDKETLGEKEKDNVKRESSNGSDKEAFHNEKELVDIPSKSVEQESSNLELKKKDHETWKHVDREARNKKKERDADVESERPEKRSRHREKDPEDCCIDAEGGTEREKQVFNCGVQQRKRVPRPRGSPQVGKCDPHFRSHVHDNEGPQGMGDISCVIYKTGECMQELIKLWKEFELSQANKTFECSHNGPTLEIRIPAEHVTATNRQVRGGQLWGTDIYTVDSDLVAVLMHTGFCRPSASPPPSAVQELLATVRVLPPQDCYISTLRNNVRSRAWGAAVGCSYRVEQCCIVKKGGAIIDLEPCLMHSSTIEPTLAPVAVERTMTTRAAASNALRQQRFVREVTIQFNLCMEPWLKYSISAVADKGLKKPHFTSSRLKNGEVLYVETHLCRYELCFNGEKMGRAAAAPQASGAETGRTQAMNLHLPNGDRNGVDGESTVVDIFRWCRCKRPLPQKFMQNVGLPLPLEYVEVLEENLEWDEIAWSQTGVWIGGKEYHLARAHFLTPS